MKKQYEVNKNAKIGDSCICPSCKSKFIKETYNQIFCKNKSGTKCKDKYWNTVTPHKRCNITRISPASREFMEQRKNNSVFGIDDYDPGDSEYWNNKDFD